MASGQAEISRSAAPMAVVGAMDGGAASGASAQESACHKMVSDAWERPPQIDAGKSNLSEESMQTMQAIEKMAVGNPNEEETLKQMKSIFKLPENATTDDINKKIDNLSRTMVKEAIGLCPGSSDSDVMKQLQEMTIDANMKAAGKENVAESFGLPNGASREQVRDAAGKDLIAKFGLSSKYSRIDEKSIPEMSKMYYDSITRQTKDNFELKF